MSEAQLKPLAWIVCLSRLTGHCWALLRCYRYTEEWTPFNTVPRARAYALTALSILVFTSLLYLTGIAFQNVTLMKAALIIQIPFESLFTVGSLATSPLNFWRLVDIALESYLFYILSMYAMTIAAQNVRRNGYFR